MNKSNFFIFESISLTRIVDILSEYSALQEVSIYLASDISDEQKQVIKNIFSPVTKFEIILLSNSLDIRLSKVKDFFLKSPTNLWCDLIKKTENNSTHDSYWSLFLNQKHPNYSSTYLDLANLELLRECLLNPGLEDVLVITHGYYFKKSAEALAKSLGKKIRILHINSIKYSREKSKPLHIIQRHLENFFKDFVLMICLKLKTQIFLFNFSNTQSSMSTWLEIKKKLLSQQKHYWVLTQFPYSWNTKGHDRFLGPAFSSAIVASDDLFNPILTYKGTRLELTWKEILFSPSMPKGVLVLEQLVSAKQILKSYFGRTVIINLRYFLRQWFSNRKLISSDYRYPLFLRDLGISVGLLGPTQFFSFAGQELGKRSKEYGLVTYFYEFSAMKSLISGFRIGNADGLVVGLQHCLYNLNNTRTVYTKSELQAAQNGQNNTIPDFFIVDGPIYEKRLTGYGIPQSKIWNLGSMRYESEWQTLVNLKSHKKSNECFTVLLALSISDLEKLLSYLPSWLSRNKVSKVLIKPHPATEKQIPIIMQTIRNTPILNDYLMRGDLEVVTGNILTFFESSDVLLTGDSSVGVEAKIAGLEVQTVAWGDQVNLYPLTEGSVVDHIKILEENH